MEYRRKSEVVSAWKVAADYVMVEQSFLDMAADPGNGVVYEEGVELSIQHGNVTVHVAPDEWVVFIGGTAWSMDDESFNDTFEPTT